MDMSFYRRTTREKRTGVDLLDSKPYETIFGEVRWALNEMKKLI